MTRRPARLVAGALALVVVAGGLAACEEEEFEAASALPAQESVTLTPAENPPFTLNEGMYRLEWKTACTAVAVTVTGDNGFASEKSSPVPNFSWILPSVPTGTYVVAQTEPSCTDWTISIVKL